jgi:hypothetical protein
MGKKCVYIGCRNIVMNRYLVSALVFYVVIQLIAGTSCHHDPVVMEEIDPQDTMDNPMDTMGIPCDPEKVYFELDVLPILKSNCAVSRCHDVTTAQKDIILDSYANVINSGKVTPFDLDESKIYRVITETEPEDRMPPDPNNPLNANQIELISKWILQGAEDLICDPTIGECDTVAVSFSTYVFPTLQNNCIGCHSGGNPAGGQLLQSYDDIRPVALSGKLSAVISWAPGVPRMPQNSDKLDECTIDKIKSWVQNGAQNN